MTARSTIVTTTERQLVSDVGDRFIEHTPFGRHISHTYRSSAAMGKPPYRLFGSWQAMTEPG